MMEEKIIIKICTGTTCFLLGGGALQYLPEKLPEHLKNKVDIKAVPCLELCQKDQVSNAPYILINNIPMGNATPESVIKAIENILHEKSDIN